MIKELSDLGKKLREEESDNRLIHDALKEEPMAIDLVIRNDGSFRSFILFDKIPTTVEALSSKKGKARLLLDKPEEVLGYKEELKKHQLFIDKIQVYSKVGEIKPVLLFYGDNKINGLEVALKEFEKAIPEKERANNIAFRIFNQDKRIHEESAVYKAIIKNYERIQSEQLSKKALTCSICGEKNYPVVDTPHGMIKKVPDGQKAGCALVSYNAKAFESYGLAGNLNSKICTNCARTYVEGLNWLLSNGKTINFKTKNGKGKQRFQYSNRKNFGSDTAIVFWTRSNEIVKELDLINETIDLDIFEAIDKNLKPDEKEVRSEELQLLLNSPFSAKIESLSNVDIDRFYACILSGAAARIAIRDWIEISISQVKNNIKKWFNDIGIIRIENDRVKTAFYSIKHLSESCAIHRKKESDGKSYYSCDYKDPIISRVGTILWNIALRDQRPPISIIDKVMRRIKSEEGRINGQRASLIKLILNRNNNGGVMIQEKLDTDNKATAYICGRIFSVLESIQRAALGKNINAGIRERFFSFASTSPSSAFGRLMKMSQNHLSKLKGEKPGFAVVLDKELQELFSNIKEFPVVFSLEEQGQFAIGYYHQKQDNFRKAIEKDDYKAIIEEEEE